jgi:hypothetical protein
MELAYFFHPDYRRKLTPDEEVLLAGLEAKADLAKPEIAELLILRKLKSAAFNGGKVHLLHNKKMRTHLQGCYDDGKYLFLSPDFCNQKKNNQAKQKWVATYDHIGTPVWVCTACRSVYPRSEK